MRRTRTESPHLSELDVSRTLFGFPWKSGLVERPLPPHCPVARASALVRSISCRVAVGTRVAPRPPHRSVRAPLRIRLLPRVLDGETLIGPGVKDLWLREPVAR